MDLDEINALNPKTREKYQNIMNSGSYEKFLMLEGLNTESTHYKKIKSDMTLTKGGLSKIKSFLKEPTKKQIRKTGMVRELQIDKQKLKIQNKNLTNEVSRLKTQIEELRRENQISERSSYSLKKTLRGISADVGKLAIIQYVLENVDKKTRILDVGLGSGVYGKLLRAFYYRNIDGIDVHGENIDELGLDVIYDNIYIENILDFDFEHYDLIIFGDVLEHIELELAKNLLERFIEEDKCENIIVSIPFEYEQDEMYGNLHEIHLQPDVNSEYYQITLSLS